MGEYKVVVASTYHEEQNGNNWVYLKGRNVADDSGYQTRTFAEYKGKATKLAEQLDTLNKDDFVLVETKMNGKFENLAGITILEDSPPENTKPASNKSSGGSRSGGSKTSYSGGGGSSDKMSKADWAAKDAKKEASMARHKALVVAATVKVSEGNTDSESIIKLAEKFEAYLLDTAVEPVKPEPYVSPNNGSDDTPPAPGDDDIPF